MIQLGCSMENRILVSNIQRFCLHDGPGIRTTVFLKGCSLRCPWCSNPENISFSVQKYCKDGVDGIYGKWYEPKELLEIIFKDSAFYERKDNHWVIDTGGKTDALSGGVTFSGGECLLQAKQLVPVFKNLKENGIHITAETCLFVPTADLGLALEYIDFFYVDMKLLDMAECKEVENGDISLYLKNLETLFRWRSDKGNRKPVVIRIPVIGKYTDSESNRKAVKQLLKDNIDNILKIELIQEHNLGLDKYKSLHKPVTYYGVTDHLMNIYKEELSSLNVPIEICKI